MIAISLITVILAALGTFTLNSVALTSQLRARQAAAQVATSAMASLGAVPATDLVTGRDTTSVTAQFGAAPGSVSPSLAAMIPLSDTSATAGAGATATISTSPVPQVLNNITFSVNTYLGRCFMQAVSTDCRTTGAGVEHLRAVVAVTWKGRGCGSTTCTYVTTTLVNQDDDPVFNLNTANPPLVPAVEGPGNQVSTLGATVSMQLAAKANTGVPPLTWLVTTGTLPAGLTLSGSGLVTGVPTALGTSTLTVTVTDAFGRTGSVAFTWAIVAAPSVTKPNALTSTQGSAVSLPVVSTCPNAPCVYTIGGAPPALSINATTGVISGVPTTLNIYSVTVTITDSDMVARTTPAFTWTVIAPPSVTTPATLKSTVGNVESVPLAYTCSTANCTLVLTGTAPGIGLSATTPNSTNNTVTTLGVTGPSGTVFLSGTVQASAVPSGTSQAYAPRVKITDGIGANVTSAAGNWTMFVKPTVGPLGTRTVTVGAAKNVPIPYTCPNVSCTFTLAGTVPGLGLSTVNGATGNNTTTTLTVAGASGTIYINGTVQGSAVPTGTTKDFALTLTITDSDGAKATATATWTASTAPKITNPGSQAMEPNQNLSLAVAAACPNGGCTWQAATQVGDDPTWYPVAISGGVVTSSDVSGGTYLLRVIVTDSDGITDTAFIPLRVATFSLPIPTQASTRPASGTKVVTLDASDQVTPAADGYTYAISGPPSWLAINPATGLLTATLTTSSVTDTAITVTVTSKVSSTSAVSTAFQWNIS